MPHEIDQILRDFLMESQENLQRADQELIKLEQDPDNREILADVFRTIHSIKGSAGFLKLPHLEELAHAAEEALSKARKGDIRLTPRHITCVLHTFDNIRSILYSLERTGEEGDHAIRQVIQHLQLIAQGQIPIPDPKDACPAARTVLSASQPAGMSEPALTIPPSGLAESAGIEAERALEDAIRTDATNVEPAEGLPASGDILAESVEDTRVRVHVNVLDHLMNLTGELVLARNQVVRRANDTRDPGWQSIAQRLHSVVADLQETMLKARMQEIRQVFGLFPRLVRDLSKQYGKDVQLRMDGQKTELDRTLIEGLKEPLVHLIRNALDHGIEPPSVRRQHGKPATGTISIRAYHESGQVHIEVSDDGAGIDIDRIKHQAVKQGLLTPDQAAEATIPTLLELIFRPGFSTAKTVTNISGRGVGMDVVRQHLNQMGGTIEITTNRGQGTTFHIRLPMTLAIISGLLVSSHDRYFVIPQQNLEELVRLDHTIIETHAIQQIAGAEVFRLRGDLLPLIRLTTLLHLPSQEASADENPHILILSTGDRRFGLLVDNVSDTEEIVVKPLGRHIKQRPCYDGATIIGDGNVALILNARGLFATARFRLDDLQRAEHLEAQATPALQEHAQADLRQTIVLFTAGPNEYYGVPLAFVERIETFAAEKIETSGGHEILQYRGEVLPLMRLEPLLHLASPPETPILSLLVFAVEKEIGLIAQKVINTVEISTQIDAKRFQQKGVLGSTIVQGLPVLILDVHGLIELAYPQWYQHLLTSKLPEAERQQIRVLLVEDSRFFLNIEQSYLASAGYQVVTAEHGQEALEILKQQPIDVVVTDIEMPYCNGYDLTKAIKTNPEWQHIPVMAVTALSGEEDRKRGIAVGIDEYRIKLDRDEVLRALEQLMLRTRKRGESV